MARFADLPSELVGLIWLYLEHDDAGKRHLCRSTIPYTRRNNLGTAHAQRIEQLYWLDVLLEEGARVLPGFDEVTLGTYVRNLTLLNLFVWHEEERRAQAASAWHILSGCVGLERLVLHGSSLQRVLLSAEPASLRFSNLHTLEFCDFEGGDLALFDMEFLVRLCRFPSLRNLVITAPTASPESSWLQPHARRPEVFDIPQVNSLDLSLGAVLESPAAANFISCFPSLTSLHLEIDDVVAGHLGRFLQACPPGIAHLAFKETFSWRRDDSPPAHIDAYVARFVNLTHLTLGAGTYAPSCEIFAILAANSPHLAVLQLEHHTSLVADKVTSFVFARGGSSRSLKRLVVDSIYGKADPIPSQAPDRPDIVDGSFPLEHVWDLPRWTPTFSCADARELVAAAASVGIELLGGLLGAIQVEKLRPREEAYLQERRDEVLYALSGLFGEA